MYFSQESFVKCLGWIWIEGFFSLLLNDFSEITRGKHLKIPPNNYVQIVKVTEIKDNVTITQEIRIPIIGFIQYLGTYVFWITFNIKAKLNKHKQFQ